MLDSIKVRQDIYSTIIFHHKVKLNLLIVTSLGIVYALYTKNPQVGCKPIKLTKI